VYLARLAPSGRRSQAQALEVVAGIASGGQARAATFPWASLRYQHVQALRAALVERGYAPASVNKCLYALRGVLTEAWRLGLLEDGDYHRAVDVHNVRGETLPRGRALSGGELHALANACAWTPPRQARVTRRCWRSCTGAGSGARKR